jgi:hypothetical protein
MWLGTAAWAGALVESAAQAAAAPVELICLLVNIMTCSLFRCLLE